MLMMVFTAVESENALTAIENSAQLKEQFQLLSQQRSSLEMEVPNAASGAAILKTPPPAAAGSAQIDKENLTLADRIRSPALDASYSKDQWRTIAIQAAARANGDVYAEWKDSLPIDALDMQPEGNVSARSTDDVKAGRSERGTENATSNTHQPLAGLNTGTGNATYALRAMGSSEQPVQAQAAAQEEAVVPAAKAEAGIPSDSTAQMSASQRLPADDSTQHSASTKEDHEVTEDAPATDESAADGDSEPKASSLPPEHQQQLSGSPSNGLLPAHMRQLSGGSSGSILSGNPYASSCGASHAGSTGGSPAGSLSAESSQARLQRELSGNPFAPPGTLRSRPVSPFVEPVPCHRRSSSLPPADLPMPAPAALADYVCSLSLPYTSHALTGAQLYQMHQSPMPEEGETFRPAKDILQELFFRRASQPGMSEDLEPAAEGQTGKSLGASNEAAGNSLEADPALSAAGKSPEADNETISSLPHGHHEPQANMQEQPQPSGDSSEGHQAADWARDLPEDTQSWEPMWGTAGQTPVRAVSSPFSQDALQSGYLGESRDPTSAESGSQLQPGAPGQDSWEAAWRGSFASEVPDQAAASDSAEPTHDAACDPAWIPNQLLSSMPPQQDFTLLLPSREPPLPPTLTGPEAQRAMQSEQGAAQQAESAAHRDCFLPVMRAEDRQKCVRFFNKGFAEKGGVSASAAQLLHARSGSQASFEATWQLVSPGPVSTSLDCSSFCLFMHLLKTSIKGIQLPASIWPDEAKEVVGLSPALCNAAADSKPTAQAPKDAVNGREADKKVSRRARAQNFSFFQPFQSGMQQSSLGRRPSTAESPSRQYFSQARSGMPPSLTRPASADESSPGQLTPRVSPCGALVAKAVREANREGAGQVWQPLASRQLDSWAVTSGPSHALSAPAPWQQQVPPLAHQGQLRRNNTDIPSPRRVCPTLPSPRSSEGSPDSKAGRCLRRPSIVPQADSEKLSITVNGAKVEYGKSLDRPFFSLSLHDASGKRLEYAQDTPPGYFDRRTYIITAGHDLQFKTPMRQIPPESVVYIEVKHWKTASKKMSTLGWSFAPIEMFIDTSSENTTARAGQLFLQLYKKPMSFTAHSKNGQLKQLRSKGHDLYLTLN